MALFKALISYQSVVEAVSLTIVCTFLRYRPDPLSLYRGEDCLYRRAPVETEIVFLWDPLRAYLANSNSWIFILSSLFILSKEMY